MCQKLRLFIVLKTGFDEKFERTFGRKFQNAKKNYTETKAGTMPNRKHSSFFGIQHFRN